MTTSDKLFPITVTCENGYYTIEWDQKDVVTSSLNNWTEEDFTEAIRVGCAELLLEQADD